MTDYQNIKIKVQAAMETGNQSVARSLFRELLEVNYTCAMDLHSEVREAYNVSLI